MLEAIPPITHPMGRSWDQPDRAEVLVDDKHAVMTVATLQQLHEYSHSIPTGVYEGKMWRAKANGRWYLHWFAAGVDPAYCSHNVRPILLVGGDG